MRRNTLKFLAVTGLMLLAGCGFQLRDQTKPLPFDGAVVEAGATSVLASHSANSALTRHWMDSVLAGRLRNYLAQQAKLAASREKADVIIRLTGESRVKSILSLSGAGKVREFRLTHTVSVSAVDSAGKELLIPTEIRLAREFSYSDEQVLAKEAEEAMLHKEMDDDAFR